MPKLLHHVFFVCLDFFGRYAYKMIIKSCCLMLKNRALNLSQTAFLYRFWLVKNHGLKILFRVVQYLWKSLYCKNTYYLFQINHCLFFRRKSQCYIDRNSNVKFSVTVTQIYIACSILSFFSYIEY